MPNFCLHTSQTGHESFSSGCWEEPVYEVDCEGGAAATEKQRRRNWEMQGGHLPDLSITFSFLQKVRGALLVGGCGRYRDKWTNPAFSHCWHPVPSPGAGEVASSREHVVTLPSSCNYWPFVKAAKCILSKVMKSKQNQDSENSSYVETDQISQTGKNCKPGHTTLDMKVWPENKKRRLFSQRCVHLLVFILNRK